MKKNFKYVFGPVPSWRIGSSLGVDLLSKDKKICNFDCIYCQLGKTSFLNNEREIFVDIDEVLNELKQVPLDVKIDYITFSGRGEPTLAKNLKEAVFEIKKIRKEPLAILTNSGNIYLKETQEALLGIDFVIPKIDATNEELFQKINQPAKGITLEKVINGIKTLRQKHKKRFAIQTMILSENINLVDEFAKIYLEINPTEIQLNTPLRPSEISPVSKEKLYEFSEKLSKKINHSIEIKTVYGVEKPKVEPISTRDTLRRRGKVI